MLQQNASIQNNFHVLNEHTVGRIVRSIRENGGCEYWVLNKTYMEIYHFKFTMVSEFDVQIDLTNSLANEHLLTGIFVLHMKDKIAKLLKEVPGTFYEIKFECYKELYLSLYDKFNKSRTKKTKETLAEKIEFIECEFPHLVL